MRRFYSGLERELVVETADDPVLPWQHALVYAAAALRWSRARPQVARMVAMDALHLVDGKRQAAAVVADDHHARVNDASRSGLRARLVLPRPASSPSATQMMSSPRTLTSPSTVPLRRCGSEWIVRGSATSSNTSVGSANHSAPMRKMMAECRIELLQLLSLCAKWARPVGNVSGRRVAIEQRHGRGRVDRAVAAMTRTVSSSGQEASPRTPILFQQSLIATAVPTRTARRQIVHVTSSRSAIEPARRSFSAFAPRLSPCFSSSKARWTSACDDLDRDRGLLR